MKIFLDTVEESEIKEFLHLIDGITTNPSLASKQKIEYFELAKKLISTLGSDKEISIQVVSESRDEMLKEAILIGSTFHKNVLIKLPCNADGLYVCSKLKDNDKLLSNKVNMTLCFSGIQALLAAKSGADYISIFLGRANDLGVTTDYLIEECVEVIQDFPDSKILSASIRSVDHFRTSARQFAHAITLPYGVLKTAINSPLSELGLQKFMADYKNR